MTKIQESLENSIIVTDDFIQFIGFPLLPENGLIYVYRTKDYLTIYPFKQEGDFYSSYIIARKMITKESNPLDYGKFATMLTLYDERPKYGFIEYNGVYVIKETCLPNP